LGGAAATALPWAKLGVFVSLWLKICAHLCLSVAKLGVSVSRWLMRLFCAGIVAAQKPDPAILHGTTAMPPESVPLPAREQQGRHNQHRDTGQSYPDGFHDLRQNPPIPKPCREVFDRACRP